VTRRSGNGQPAWGRGEREGVSAGVHKVEGNTSFDKYAKAAWAEWAEQGFGGLRGKVGQCRRGWAEWAKI
jgi:hypothetical protein